MPVVPGAPPPDTGPSKKPPAESAALLDLIVGQRQSTFRFTLLDIDLAVLGTLDVARDKTPKIENNINRTIKRALTDLELVPSDANQIDTLTSRVEVEMILSDESEWPLGLFLFTANNRAVFGYGTPLAPSLADQTTILAQPIARSLSVRPNSSIVDVLVKRLSLFRLPRGGVIDDSDARTGSKAAMVWPPGTDNFKVLTDLCRVAGFASPYFDNAGVLQIGRARTVSPTTQPDHVYEADGRILTDSIVFSDDLLDTPNRFLVIDSSATENPISAFYDLPEDDPASKENRGFVMVHQTDAQSVGSVDNAYAMAKRDAALSRTAETANFDSPPDPRHDTFGVVRLLGNFYREQSWTMQLKEGESMSHELRRSYG